jgi:hypothetical protein
MYSSHRNHWGQQKKIISPLPHGPPQNPKFEKQKLSFLKSMSKPSHWSHEDHGPKLVCLLSFFLSSLDNERKGRV